MEGDYFVLQVQMIPYTRARSSSHLLAGHRTPPCRRQFATKKPGDPRMRAYICYERTIAQRYVSTMYFRPYRIANPGGLVVHRA